MFSLVGLALLPIVAIASSVAAESWTFLYPLVIMNATLTADLESGKQNGYNSIHHSRAFASVSDHSIVRMNVDTLYSETWFDLPAGADFLTIHVPDTQGRYYVWQFMDMWTNTFLSIGARTTGTAAQSFRLIGPGYPGPMDESTFEAPTRNGFAILRILCDGPEDYASVNALQDGFSVSYSGANAPMLSLTQPLPPPDIVRAMGAQEFFVYASDVMVAGNMPKEIDSSMVSKLATIGVVPGELFDWNSLSSSTRASLELGVSKAKLLVCPETGQSSGGSGSPSWGRAGSFIGNYSDHYSQRAQTACSGLGANIQDDALYLAAKHGSDRGPLKGDRNYTITFGPGQLPPVNGFWSVTVYDENYYLIPNSADAYALGDRTGLVSAADGSTTIYLRPAAPQDETASANWLPIPNGASFSLTMRLYWPKDAALHRSWVPPFVVPEGSIVASVLV